MRRRMPAWKLVKAKSMRKNPTPSEALLWSYLRSKQLGVKFRRQALVWGWIVDFWCPAKRLVVEIDGASHWTAEQRTYDKHRNDTLREYGLRVLRFHARLVERHPEQVVSAIRTALKRSSVSPVPSSTFGQPV